MRTLMHGHAKEQERELFSADKKWITCYWIEFEALVGLKLSAMKNKQSAWIEFSYTTSMIPYKLTERGTNSRFQ